MTHRGELSQSTSTSWVKSMLTSGLISQHAYILCCSGAEPVNSQSRLNPRVMCSTSPGAAYPSHSCRTSFPSVLPSSCHFSNQRLANQYCRHRGGVPACPSILENGTGDTILLALTYTVPPAFSPTFIKATFHKHWGAKGGEGAEKREKASKAISPLEHSLASDT